jgi:hypothetical protein
LVSKGPCPSGALLFLKGLAEYPAKIITVLNVYGQPNRQFTIGSDASVDFLSIDLQPLLNNILIYLALSKKSSHWS